MAQDTYRDAHTRTEADTPDKDSPGDDEYRALKNLLCTMSKLRGEGGRREEHIV
jgi:hypothetical protein